MLTGAGAGGADGSEMGRFPHFEMRRQVGLAQFHPSTTPPDTCKVLHQLSAEGCVLGKTFGCNAQNKTLWTRGCRGTFQCGTAQVTCDPHPAPTCEVSCDQGGFAGEWTRLSQHNPLDAGFRPASPGIENPVVTRSMDVSRHDIAGIWVAFFSRCQRYRCGQGEWWIAVYHIYTGPTVGVSYSRDGVYAPNPLLALHTR